MSHHISDEQRDAARSDGHIVAKVAAELGTGDPAAADCQPVGGHLQRRQQALLKDAGFSKFLLEPLDVPSVLAAAPAQLETAIHQRLQHFTIKRFLNEIKGSSTNGANELLIEVVEAAGHHDDVDPGMIGLQPGHQLESVEFGHADVKKSDVRLELRGERDGLPGRLTPGHSVQATQHAFYCADHPWFVVHDENTGSVLHTAARAAGTGTHGTVTRIRVPLCCSLCRLMVPPTSQRIDRQMDNPRPLPLILVVKNGSKTLLTFSGAMPQPVSATAMDKRSDSGSIRTVTVSP